MKKNTPGLPDHLKSGIENLSGYSMDDVTVHYNSDVPAQLKSHLYDKGMAFTLDTTRKNNCLMKHGVLYSKKMGK